MLSTILLLLITSVTHCTTLTINDASLITMLLLKTGGNTGWIANWHHASNYSEEKEFKNSFLVGGKDNFFLFLLLHVLPVLV